MNYFVGVILSLESGKNSEKENLSSLKKPKKSSFYRKEKPSLRTSCDVLISSLYLSKYGEALFFLKKILTEETLKEFIKVFENESFHVPSYKEYKLFEIEIEIIKRIMLSPSAKLSESALRKMSEKYEVPQPEILKLFKKLNEQYKEFREIV